MFWSRLSLFLFWGAFIILVSCGEEVDIFAYSYCSSIILYLTYYANTYQQYKLSLQMSIILFTLPSCLLWYVIITYNYFLKVFPFSYHLIVAIMFTYFYVFIYLFSEYW